MALYGRDPLRAGEFGLRLLSTPANVRVLGALEAEAALPPIDPGLSELGLFESEPDAGAPVPTRSGLGLLSVANVLAKWLSISPKGTRQLGQPSAKRVILALLGGWGSGIVRALAARSFSPAELQRLLPGLQSASLEKRMLAMTGEGLVEAEAGEDGVERLAATEWLRFAAGPLAASARWERQYLPAETTPITAVDVESVFLLLVPLMSPAEPVSGTCRMAVELPIAADQGAVAGVVVSVRDGVVDSHSSRFSDETSASVEGSTRAWLRAVIDGKDDRLRFAGDVTLAEILLRYSLDLPWRPSQSTKNLD